MSKVLAAYERHYGRVYNPEANQLALEEKKKQKKHAEKMEKLWPKTTKRRDDD